jgi:hypothetical protein
MHQIRAWAGQAIKERVTDIEWRIIKQCDLREQLTIEKEETLYQAFSGSLTGFPDFNPDLYNRGQLVQSLIHDMNELIFETGEDGVRAYSAPVQSGLLYFVFPDMPSEIRDPLGG